LRKIIIEAGSLPELVVKPKKEYYNKILKTIKESKDGLTNHELCIKLKIGERRRVSENIALMKDQGIVKQTLCRCGHAPIYYFYK